MHPGRDARSNRFGGENGAERKTGGERLGNQHDVRFRGKLLIGKEAAGAAEAALNLVGDEEGAVLGGEGASAIPESLADRIDAAFTLDCFQEDSADGIVEFRVEIGEVIEPHEFRAGYDRREGQAILFRGGNTDGAESVTYTEK